MKRALLLLVLVGCASEGGGPSEETCKGELCANAAPCPAGLERDAETGACIDVAPVEDCLGGTAAMLGRTECQPVGWTTCAAPFERSESGWGCKASTAASCSVTTREEIGSTSCVPIGDCSAPFPPPNTTITVDATLATEDATHKKSIFNAAIDAKPGDVIAVMPGKYVEDVDIARSQVTLVGKCAAEVTIQNPNDRRAGILVTAKGARVRGFTLTGHMTGVLVKGGGEALVEDVAIVDNRWLGVYAAEAGSKLRLVRSRIDGVVPDAGKFGWGASAQLGGALELEDVVITRATAHGVALANPNSTAKLTRTIVRSTRFEETKGFADGISAADGARITIDGALVDDVKAVGLMASGATVDAKHLVIQNVAVDGKGENGRGIQVSKGGKVKLQESQIESTDEANVLVLEKDSRLDMESSTIVGDEARDASRAAHGARIALGASASIKKSAIISTVDIGLSVQDPGTTAEVDEVLVRETRARKWKSGRELGVGVGVAWSGSLLLTHSSIVKNRAAGILVSRVDQNSDVGAHADIRTTLVRDTTGDEGGRFGRGIEVTMGATATIEDSAIVKNNETSIVVGFAGSSATLRRSIVRDTQQRAELFGHGVIADSESTLVLEESWLLRHPGVALAVVSSGVTVSRSLVAQSGIGVHVQGEATLEVVRNVPTPPSPRAVSVSEDTRFVENATRVGSGEIPIPSLMGLDAQR